MCVCVCVCVCACVCRHTHTYIHTYIYVYICIYIHYVRPSNINLRPESTIPLCPHPLPSFYTATDCQSQGGSWKVTDMGYKKSQNSVESLSFSSWPMPQIFKIFPTFLVDSHLVFVLKKKKKIPSRIEHSILTCVWHQSFFGVLSGLHLEIHEDTRGILSGLLHLEIRPGHCTCWWPIRQPVRCTQCTDVRVFKSNRFTLHTTYCYIVYYYWAVQFSLYSAHAPQNIGILCSSEIARAWKVFHSLGMTWAEMCSVVIGNLTRCFSTLIDHDVGPVDLRSGTNTYIR